MDSSGVQSTVGVWNAIVIFCAVAGVALFGKRILEEVSWWPFYLIMWASGLFSKGDDD
mgnify:CR=1 FL=1